MTPAELRQTLGAVPALLLAPLPTPVAAMPRLSAVLGGGPRLLVKRDDTIGFAFGGNKVRKLALLGAQAQADGADTLITAGGLQSNHARVTAATAVTLGMRAVLVVNGAPPRQVDRQCAARCAPRRRSRVRRIARAAWGGDACRR